MNRDTQLNILQSRKEPWDVVIIGGGATGAGCAVDAASRGYSAVLFEQCDFGKGTSSRSTKLAHGGVRYLRKGAFGLVSRALKERTNLLRNAPHVVRERGFIIPASSWLERSYYGLGLKLYDSFAFGSTLPASRILSASEAEELAPTLNTKELSGGVVYFDGQFDDARLNINLIQTAVEQGATALNYAKVTGFTKHRNKVVEVLVTDLENNKSYVAACRSVINACGPYSDAIRKMDDENAPPRQIASRGVHVVVDKSFLPSDYGILIPHTDDKRVIFAIPWHDSTLIGTTDSPQPDASIEPRATKADVDYVLDHTCRCLDRCPLPTDVKSVFAGIRPLVGDSSDGRTASISRDHSVSVSDSGVVTVSGGKWTTYRHMAEDAVNNAAKVGKLRRQRSQTRRLKIHGCDTNHHGKFQWYGADAVHITALVDSASEMARPLDAAETLIAAQVIWAARHEMARTVEDVLARRTRVLFYDANKAIELAPAVAVLLASELGKDQNWEQEQVNEFTALAKQYFYPSS
ncbi:MAG: glycerol-3-phosphate dehydrogenase/oxidase [Bdellovibrionales bacterium]|nr:glycerol-3-phosphate dehydrogenase/oxidase [Bdellovibrionales bacterium]